MKPTITLKRDYDDGHIESVEVFRYKKGTVLHRHVLTKDPDRARMYGIYRVFWDTFYCKQEIVLMDDEVSKIIELLHDNKQL